MEWVTNLTFSITQTHLKYYLGLPFGHPLHSVSLRLIKSDLDKVLLEHGGLPCVLPFAVHVDLEHLETQGYLGLLSEPCEPRTPVVSITHDHLKLP